MIRLTEDVIKEVLRKNEGFMCRTMFSGNDYQGTNTYRIKDGKLLCREQGRALWTNEELDRTVECDIERTRRFIRARKKEFGLMPES